MADVALLHTPDKKGSHSVAPLYIVEAIRMVESTVNTESVIHALESRAHNTSHVSLISYQIDGVASPLSVMGGRDKVMAKPLQSLHEERRDKVVAKPLQSLHEPSTVENVSLSAQDICLLLEHVEDETLLAADVVEVSLVETVGVMNDVPENRSAMLRLSHAERKLYLYYLYLFFCVCFDIMSCHGIYLCR